MTIRQVTKARRVTSVCVHEAALPKFEERLNLYLYSFKHLVHSINVPHVTIMFIFYYDSST
jgi:hypothetical protein